LSIFSRLFGRTKQPEGAARAEVLSGSPAFFTPFSGNAWENDIYRAAVDAIARNAGKLKGRHIVNYQGQRKDGDPVLNRLLQVQPNPYMTAYDLQYKLVVHYYQHNTSFAFLQKNERGDLEAIWPLKPLSMEFVTDPTGELYCRFIFAGGRTVILPFRDVLILRRHFNTNDLLGDINTAILPTLDLAHTQSEYGARGLRSFNWTGHCRSSDSVRAAGSRSMVSARERLLAADPGHTPATSAVSCSGMGIPFAVRYSTACR